MNTNGLDGRRSIEVVSAKLTPDGICSLIPLVPGVSLDVLSTHIKESITTIRQPFLVRGDQAVRVKSSSNLLNLVSSI